MVHIFIYANIWGILMVNVTILWHTWILYIYIYGKICLLSFDFEASSCADLQKAAEAVVKDWAWRDPKRYCVFNPQTSNIDPWTSLPSVNYVHTSGKPRKRLQPHQANCVHRDPWTASKQCRERSFSDLRSPTSHWLFDITGCLNFGFVPVWNGCIIF